MHGPNWSLCSICVIAYASNISKATTMRRLARKRTTKAVRPGDNQNHVFETQTVALMVETFDFIHVNSKPWQLHQGPCILEPRKPPRWQEKNPPGKEDFQNMKTLPCQAKNSTLLNALRQKALKQTEGESRSSTKTHCLSSAPQVWIPFGEHPLKLERYRED